MVSTFILTANIPVARVADNSKFGLVSCVWHLPSGKLSRQGRAGGVWGAPSLWRDKIVGKFSKYSTWAASCSTHGVYAGSLTDVTRTGQRWLFTTQAPLGVAPSIVELVSLKLVLALLSHWNYMYSWLELIVSLKLGLALMLSQISMKQQSCEVKAEPRVARKAFDFKTLQGYFEGLDNRALKRKDFSPKAPPSVADRAFEFKTLQGLFEEQGRASALKRKVGTAVKKWPSSEEKNCLSSLCQGCSGNGRVFWQKQQLVSWTLIETWCLLWSFLSRSQTIFHHREKLVWWTGLFLADWHHLSINDRIT